MASEWGGMSPAEKTIENKLRRQAKRLGLEIKKSRVREIHLHDHGGYQIVALRSKRLVHGELYSLSLSEVHSHLALEEERLRAGREL